MLTRRWALLLLVGIGLLGARPAQACTGTISITINADSVAESEQTSDYASVTLSWDGCPSDTVIQFTYGGSGELLLHNSQGGNLPILAGTSGSVPLSVQGKTASSQLSGASVTADAISGGQSVVSQPSTASKPVVKLDSLTVESGASRTNVCGEQNWVGVKASTGDVIVKAVLQPDGAAAPVGLAWTGGAEVQGQPLKRKVSKANSAKTTVSAVIGSRMDFVDVWIIWTTIDIQYTETTPQNAVQFGEAYDRTENLGGQTYENGTKAVGKVVPIAQITPPGAGTILKKEGWAFTRDKKWHCFCDGIKDAPFWYDSWEPDNSWAQVQNLTPDANDRIYDRDAPDISGARATDSSESYLNLRQLVKWNTVVCSDYAYWYWKGRWKNDATPKVTLKDVASVAAEANLPALPANGDPFYKYWVSGTITKGGNPLQDATITCGTKTATSAADGTYTVKDISPGAQAVTPTKAGETFNPASRNVNLTGTVVGGQDFAAN